MHGALPDDFSSRYEATLGSYRIPDALKTYAAKMKALQDPAITTCLGEHIASVLDGTYLQRRYALEGNPHLQKIPAETLKKWRENCQIPLTKLLEEEEDKDAVQKQETMFQWLHQRLIQDNPPHMDLVLFPFLEEYLKSADEKERGGV